jgi:thiamine transporter
MIFNAFNFEGILIEWWQFGLLIGCIAVIVGLVFVSLHLRQRVVLGRGEAYVDSISTHRDVSNIRDIVFGGLALGLSFVLTLFPLWTMPFGGDITLASALPLLMYSYVLGFKKAIVVCFAFFLLFISYNPYIVTPFSAVLDYVVPSFALSLTGLFTCKNKANPNQKSTLIRHKNFFIGLLLYFVVRLASHTLAGAIFWSQGIDFGIWKGDLVGWSAWSYSFVYNIIYLLPDTLIVLVAGYLMLKNKRFDTYLKLN